MIKFWRSICKFDEKGISVNQEMLYNCLNANPKFTRNFLFKTRHNKGQLEFLVDH